MGADELSGAGVVLRFIESRTNDLVFGLPGSSTVPIMFEMADRGVRFVPALQENAAVAVADGYARLAGPTSVLLYMFPGVATGLSNLYNAFRDETPLVVLVSQLASVARRGQAHVGEADVVDVLRPVTRSAFEVSSARALAPALDAAFRAAVGPPAGPTAVVIPEDVLKARLPLDAAAFPARERRPSGADDVSELVDRLTEAQRPLLVVGGQVRRCGGATAVEELAELLEIPVCYEPFWNDRLGVSPGHRCAVGPADERSPFVTDADVVVALGCRLFNEIHPKEGGWFGPGTFVAHLNADAGKVEQVTGASWSCVCDPGLAARELADRARKRDVDPASLDARRQRLEHLRQRTPRGPFIAVAAALSDTLDHGYLVDESVSASSAIVSALAGSRGERYLSTSGGSLGWGIGAACGVALAGGEPVTCVLGDGAFFFGLQALWVAVAERLPVTFVVLDNGGFGSTQYFEKRHARAAGGRPGFIGADFRDLSRPGLPAVARAFGLEATSVLDSELNDALEAARGRGPALLHVPVGPNAPAGDPS